MISYNMHSLLSLTLSLYIYIYINTHLHFYIVASPLSMTWYHDVEEEQGEQVMAMRAWTLERLRAVKDPGIRRTEPEPRPSHHDKP